ncbi:MAG: hypothetical protein J2P36_16130 [Ktedonobacteraceae bacterium]|nr:hypothetical protein [Ktedonobacteraceae bacterium]
MPSSSLARLAPYQRALARLQWAIDALYEPRSSETLQQPVYQQQRKEALEALLLFVKIIYGPPQAHQYRLLCDVCHRRYSEHTIQQLTQRSMIWCCSSCLERLQAEGTTLAVRSSKRSPQTTDMPQNEQHQPATSLVKGRAS